MAHPVRSCSLKVSRKVLDSTSVPSRFTDLDTLINALAERKDVQKLTAVSNNVGSGERGLGESQAWSKLKEANLRL